ncbi:hypothetical protein B0H15DRAFT_246037 [Mycena belliarum]|uniref:Uncharacterized protein n=1 Tax=Mycena belliarum TaxID=1033014 RepID=A0AAD6U4T6_9AGAR|nr:hypothetical protein B0H15DRAFT_246037 [Mycena belliae]
MHGDQPPAASSYNAADYFVRDPWPRGHRTHILPLVRLVSLSRLVQLRRPVLGRSKRPLPADVFWVTLTSFLFLSFCPFQWRVRLSDTADQERRSIFVSTYQAEEFHDKLVLCRPQSPIKYSVHGRAPSRQRVEHDFGREIDRIRRCCRICGKYGQGLEICFRDR